MCTCVSQPNSSSIEAEGPSTRKSDAALNLYPTNVENWGELLTVFQYTRISNKMQSHTIYLYLETSLHVLGGTATHHQERIQLYLQHLVFATPLLLSAAIVEELEPV
jgi:hypothetical protein